MTRDGGEAPTIANNIVGKVPQRRGFVNIAPQAAEFQVQAVRHGACGHLLHHGVSGNGRTGGVRQQRRQFNGARHLARTAARLPAGSCEAVVEHVDVHGHTQHFVWQRLGGQQRCRPRRVGGGLRAVGTHASLANEE
jgi:hypothetical protein